MQQRLVIASLEFVRADDSAIRTLAFPEVVTDRVEVLDRALMPLVTTIARACPPILPHASKPPEQFGPAYVAVPDPDYGRPTAVQLRPQREVFVFRHDDCRSLNGVLPKDRVGGIAQRKVEHVLAVVALSGQPMRECGRQLRIDQQAHYGLRSTGWSLCLAANSSTAVISSASRYG